MNISIWWRSTCIRIKVPIGWNFLTGEWKFAKKTLKQIEQYVKDVHHDIVQIATLDQIIIFLRRMPFIYGHGRYQNTGKRYRST